MALRGREAEAPGGEEGLDPRDVLVVWAQDRLAFQEPAEVLRAEDAVGKGGEAAVVVVVESAFF